MTANVRRTNMQTRMASRRGLARGPRWSLAVTLLLHGCGGLTALSADEATSGGQTGLPPLEGLSREETEQVRSLSPLPDPPPDSTNRYSDDPRAAALGQHLF